MIHDVLRREAFEFEKVEIITTEMRPSDVEGAPWEKYDPSCELPSIDVALHLASENSDKTGSFVTIVLLSHCPRMVGKRYLSDELSILGIKRPSLAS